MRVVREDLWSVEEKNLSKTVFVVTTNATINTRTGALVMGTGAALEAVKRYGPTTPFVCGSLVKHKLEQRKAHFLVGPKGEPSLEQGTPLPADDAFPFDPRFYGYISVSRSLPEIGKTSRLPEEFGIFQVKRDWWDDAELSLVERSTLMLAQSAKRNATWQFRLNFPGIGRGRLPEYVVEPLLQGLPDNVTICRR